MKENYFVFKRQFYYRAHEKSLFKIEIYPGIVAEFGEPKSKLKSKKYKLTQIMFLKERYSGEVIEEFRQRFHIKYIEKGHNGKKLPPIYKVVGRPDRLIRGGYIVVCDNSSGLRETYKRQNTYDFWLHEFYKNSMLSNDSDTLSKAIPLLIDRIKNNKDLLMHIPHSDHRVFEEIVAEIFHEYGYTVELTKKTRDGGRDIIALRSADGNRKEKLLIECKHWKDKIGVAPIREIIGVAVTEDELPTGVILATTARFTECAKNVKLNETIKIDLERKDFDDIIEWIGDYDAMQFSKPEINRYFLSLKFRR